MVIAKIGESQVRILYRCQIRPMNPFKNIKEHIDQLKHEIETPPIETMIRVVFRWEGEMNLI